ncbi:MAG TPA: hypothetical protein PLT75_01670 [Spirochaetota bacterium]|nr:hypothetical protein [Spirochaetota bacterium]
MNFVSVSGNEVQREKLSALYRDGRIPPTMLFLGPQGVGKKLIAKQFLSAVFCTGKQKPCLECPSCRQMAAGTYPDYLEIGPNERGVIPIGSEDKKEPGSVRWLLQQMAIKSLSGSTGSVIDGVDTMSDEGQSAILKTIEEPKKGDHIVLIASSKAKVLPTIMSRCFEIKFGPIPRGDMETLLVGKGFSDEDAEGLALMSGGSVAMAILLSDGDLRREVLDQCASISGYLRGEGFLSVDFSSLEKKLGKERLLDIMINIYRQNLIQVIDGKNDAGVWSALFVHDEQKLHLLIKVLLEIQKGLGRNLNIKNSLKGMLYSAFALPL